MRFKLFLLAAVSLLATACTYERVPDNSEDNIIGSKLTAESSLTSEQGGDYSKIALYDSTVDLIHQFDLNTGLLDRTLFPKAPGGTHYVLFDPAGGFVVDLTAKRLSIFNKAGTVQEPLKFVGTPKWGSFRPALGYLVIYDDLHSVGMVKINSEGNVLASRMLGPIVNSNISIAAGDVDDQGRLVLALSDGTLAVIDMDASIAVGTWQYAGGVAPFSVAGLTDINWLAPVHDSPNQVLVKTKTNPQVALVNVATKAIVGTPVTVGSGTILKTSKTYDPHVLISRGSGQTDLVFAKNSQVVTQSNYNQVNNILSSRLNVANDSWSVVDTTVSVIRVGVSTFGWILYDDPNAVTEKRMFKKYTLSTGLATALTGMPDGAKLQLTESYIFQLFPKKTGLAVTYSIDNGTSKSFPGFNLPYLMRKN